MPAEPLPLLTAQRDLLGEPRGPGRFRRYLETMIKEHRAPGGMGADDIALPLQLFNPMSREHVARRLDALLAADAEAALADEVAASDLSLRDRTFRIGLVVADDAVGGWTDRVLTDVAHRFESAAMLKRGFITALLWSGDPDEAPDALRARVRREVRAALYRAAFELTHGPALALAERMAQEGGAARFAGAVPGFGDAPAPDALVGAARAAVERALAPHRSSHAKPVITTALYGDDAAAAVGYPPLGVPAAGGYLLAAAEAPRDPRSLL